MRIIGLSSVYHWSIIDLITAQGYLEAREWLDTDGVRGYLKQKC